MTMGTTSRYFAPFVPVSCRGLINVPVCTVSVEDRRDVLPRSTTEELDARCISARPAVYLVCTLRFGFEKR